MREQLQLTFCRRIDQRSWLHPPYLLSWTILYGHSRAFLLFWEHEQWALSPRAVQPNSYAIKGVWCIKWELFRLHYRHSGNERTTPTDLLSSCWPKELASAVHSKPGNKTTRHLKFACGLSQGNYGQYYMVTAELSCFSENMSSEPYLLTLLNQIVMPSKEYDALSGSCSAFITGIQEMGEQLQPTTFPRLNQRTWLQRLIASSEIKPPDISKSPTDFVAATTNKNICSWRTFLAGVGSWAVGHPPDLIVL